MRTWVVSVVGGLLTLSCAAAADPVSSSPPKLISASLPPAVAGLAIGAGAAWLLARRGVRPLRARADQAVAALGEAEAQLGRRERLVVLGQLAGSVGHELRNPLGVMANAVYYLEMVQPDAPDDVREYHAILRTQIALAERIVTDLLDFSRVRAPQMERVAVTRLLRMKREVSITPSGLRSSWPIEPTSWPKVERRSTRDCWASRSSR